jgi:hypothetical protein
MHIGGTPSGNAPAFAQKPPGASIAPQERSLTWAQPDIDPRSQTSMVPSTGFHSVGTSGHTTPSLPRGSLTRNTRAPTRLSCAGGAAVAVGAAVPVADDSIRLGTLLALNDIELDLVAFFERFISVQLNRGVVDEHIRPIVATDESVALGVVEPLDFAFVLSHRLPPSFS